MPAATDPVKGLIAAGTPQGRWVLTANFTRL